MVENKNRNLDLSKIKVRMAGAGDIDRISFVLAASWKTAYRGIIADDYLDSLKNDRWVDFLTEKLRDNAVFSMILQDNEEIIGASVLAESEKEGQVHLVSIYLLPDKIGHGFGHVFYTGIENEMRKRGFAKCVLDVLEQNKRAITFYETHGFADTLTETAAVIGEQSYICKILEKEL